MAIKEIMTMVLQLITGLAIITGGVGFIVRWCFKTSQRISKIEDKIDALPLEIDANMIKLLLPFSVSTLNLQNNPLSPEDIARMKILMNKLQSNTITINETEDLNRFLEVEKIEAEQKNNTNLLLAISIALAAIALVVAVSKKSK